MVNFGEFVRLLTSWAVRLDKVPFIRTYSYLPKIIVSDHFPYIFLFQNDKIIISWQAESMPMCLSAFLGSRKAYNCNNFKEIVLKEH